MEKTDINYVELLAEISLRVSIKYEFFISSIKDGNLQIAYIIFQNLVSDETDDKVEWLNEYYIREVLDQLSVSEKAALWALADNEENYDVYTIEGSFPVECTDFVFEDLYYDEVLVIEYLKKYIDPFKISAHCVNDLYDVFIDIDMK